METRWPASDRGSPGSDGASPHNLEAQVSTFVGRDAELRRARDLVGAHRLVTLTGVGGSGKTRLAAEVCRRLLDDGPGAPPDGVWWVDLGRVAAADEVARACADALQVRLEPDADPVATLTTRLRDRDVLVCLDTCEHVLDVAADLADRLLRGCPRVSFLATSREPLSVDGEAVLRVPSLRADEAVRLFLERATLVATVDGAAHAADIRSICDRVDRLPLAVELTAAWTRVLTPGQLLVGLDDRFRLLTGGPRRAVPRHRALYASMAWSHDLLPEPERAVLRRVAVFAGTFGMADAVAVCAPDPVGAEDVLPLLARLVDKSLVVAQHGTGEVRYRLLDSVRQYATDQLAAAGEVVATRDRHLAWCLAAVEEAEAELRVDQDRGRARIELLGENVTAALDWGLHEEGPRADRARRLAAAMAMPWFLRGRSGPGRAALRRALELGGPRAEGIEERLRGGLALLGILAGRSGPPAGAPAPVSDADARSRLELAATFDAFFDDFARCESLGRAAATASTDPFSRDFALIMAAYSLTARDRHPEAIALAAAPLAAARDRGDRFCAGFALGIEQYAAQQTGELARAVALGHHMVATIAELGDYFGVGTLTANLALAMVLSGDIAGARLVMAPIVESVETAPDVDVVGFQVPMGQACLYEGDWTGAIRWFSRGLHRLDDFGADWTAARCLSGTVAALRRLGRRAEATALLERGTEVNRVFGSPQLLADLSDEHAFLVRDTDPARAHDLHHRALAARRDAGLLTYLPDSLEALGSLAAGERPSAHIVRILGAAESARLVIGRPRSPAVRDEYDAAVADLRAALSTAEYERAWAEGTELAVGDATELVARGRGPRDRPGSGWESLTPTERDVVRLAVEGRTNAEVGARLFMGRTTVKTHLSHVYAKLGVANRTELATLAAARRG